MNDDYNFYSNNYKPIPIKEKVTLPKDLKKLWKYQKPKDASLKDLIKPCEPKSVALEKPKDVESMRRAKIEELVLDMLIDGEILIIPNGDNTLSINLVCKQSKYISDIQVHFVDSLSELRV